MVEATASTVLDSDTIHSSVRDGQRDTTLSRAEEYELAARISGGDHEARNRMVQANMAQVVSIARAFVGRGLLIEDLIGDGNLGLIRAAEDFDPRFGTPFRTYAEYWIKEAIRASLMNTAANIRLPRYMFRLFTKCSRAERASACQLGRLPDFNETASKIGLKKRQRYLIAKARNARQLTLETDWQGPTGRLLSDEAQDRPSVEACLEADDERDVIRRCVGGLEARERAVLTLRYGLQGESLSYTEIARRLECSGEWVRKIELRSRRKLRTALSRPPASVRIRIESLYKPFADPRRTQALGGVVSAARCDLAQR